MKKVLAATLSVLALTTASVAPVFAADDDGVMYVMVGMPYRGASTATSMVFGTPIAIGRMSAKKTMEITNEIAGDDANIVMKGLSAFIGIPLGIVAGTGLGTVYGISNSIKNTPEKPFTKEQFSLAELGKD